METNNASRPVTQFQKATTYFILTLFTIQPAMAKVVVSSGNTTVEKAGNGVEVVNIATPNSQGLSHNKYHQFDVDPSGLVLNNSTEQFAQSQLAGLVQNNANLNSSGGATVILNEVTGANRSQLQGYTEVLGQSANVVLTNPYGITCDGCGFINTPRATLATGEPQVTDGALSGFEVSQGSVTIEGLGLDATQQTYFDVIARTAQINAELHANELNVVTGQNRVDYQTNTVTKRTSDDSNPSLAIDTSLLGGLYAGKISLVATEDGVGVNLGNVAAQQGDINITADGRVVFGNASAAKDIKVLSQDAISLSGQQYADGNLSYQANSIEASNATIVGKEKLTIKAQENLNLNQSNVVAGINQNGQAEEGGIINLESDGVELIASQLTAHEKLNSQATDIQIDGDSQIVSRSAELVELASLTNDGEIAVEGDLSLQGQEMTTNGGGATTAQTLNLTGKQLTIGNAVNGQIVTLDAERSLTITEEGAVHSLGELNLVAETAVQQGQLTAGGHLQLQANTLVHDGKSSADTINLQADILSQNGELDAEQTLEMNSKQLTLSGNNYAGDIVVSTGSLNHTGIIRSDGEVTLTATDTITNTEGSQVKSSQIISIDANSLRNSGDIHAGKTLSITVADDLINQTHGLLQAAENLTLEAQNTDSSGVIKSGGQLNLTASGGSITLQREGETETNDYLTVTARTLTQLGSLKAKETVTIDAENATLSGDIQSEYNVTVDADTLDLNSQITANNDITIITGSDLHTQKDLIAGRHLALSVAMLITALN
ncbi:filamentous hemagglutinin N-terminal domain-containing protein [Vibrio sonorensis]|uniref:filamentous hemagglutinin N-terminal domain-containing protein n=1 Tax=Vibrio sonorensis TaxID=1004316 RepID=UPI0008D94E82|nr:filamentous hemagglutinin N-terminal domain-containing protein [Vibrio sonorensis]